MFQSILFFQEIQQMKERMKQMEEEAKKIEEMQDQVESQAGMYSICILRYSALHLM